jgi:hypothetical protein
MSDAFSLPVTLAEGQMQGGFVLRQDCAFHFLHPAGHDWTVVAEIRYHAPPRRLELLSIISSMSLVLTSLVVVLANISSFISKGVFAMGD